jgi:hypothetical protein
MITQLLYDHYEDSRRVAVSGTPVCLIELGTDHHWVQLPNSEIIKVEAGHISSGVHSPEETLSMLAQQAGMREDTLLKAAQTARLMARKSGSTWLSTLNAIEWAVAEGRLRMTSTKVNND